MVFFFQLFPPIFSAPNLIFRSCLDSGFKHSSDPSGLSLPELLLAVETLARVHATGRAMLAKNSVEAVKKRYPYLTQDMYSNGMLLEEVSRYVRKCSLS